MEMTMPFCSRRSNISLHQTSATLWMCVLAFSNGWHLHLEFIFDFISRRPKLAAVEVLSVPNASHLCSDSTHTERQPLISDV